MPLESVHVIADPGCPGVDAALHCLHRCLESRGFRVKRRLPCDTKGAGDAGALKILVRTRTEIGHGSGVPKDCESFSIEPCGGVDRQLIVAGSDPTGTAYGIYELTGIFASAGQGQRLDRIPRMAASPFLAVRSVNQFLHNRALEWAWLRDPAYWDFFFGLLVRCRLNQFTLTFGHQTAYLAPPYPFLVRVPGYEHVRTPGFSHADRKVLLGAVRMIGEKAETWGIRFVVGVWEQHPGRFGRSEVEGLSRDRLIDYCPRAIRCLLEACPSIKGLQFRMNAEAGIPENEQARFFGRCLEAARACREDLWIDLRAKGLREESIRRAAALGFDVTVSTKFWTEHMGLPFFLSQTQPVDTNRRYGYWDLLRRDRTYRLLYRLWTVGSNKLLSWGDLEYASRFAECCRVGGGIGFEICAPLSNRGFGNGPGGDRCVLADPDLRFGRWDMERYWPFLMAFGLSGYRPHACRPVYAAMFEERFGEKRGRTLRRALAIASRVIPQLVAAHLPSPSTFGFWPEMYAGGSTDVYSTVRPSEWKRYYSIEDYVSDRLAGRRQPLVDPADVADRLDAMAEQVDEVLVPTEQCTLADAEARHLEVDIRLLAMLARYHAARFRSSLAYVLYRKTGDAQRIHEAVRLFDRAVEHWRRVSALADVYDDSMVFNRPPDQVGHWRDEIPFLEAERERLVAIAALADKAEPELKSYRKRCGEWIELPMEWDMRDGVPVRRKGDVRASSPLDGPEGVRASHLGYTIGNRYVMETPQSVVARAGARHLPDCPDGILGATPASIPVQILDASPCAPGRWIRVRALCREEAPDVVLELHFRRMHQAEGWLRTPMRLGGDGIFTGWIPGSAVDAAYDMMIAVSALCGERWGFAPDQDPGPPYRVLPLHHAQDLAAKGLDAGLTR